MDMKKINILKDYLFGTPDRIYTFVSVILSILSIFITVFTYRYPDKIPELIIVRDISVIALLLLTSGILLWKYIRREQHLIIAVNDLEESNKRLSRQFERFHLLVHKFRCDVFLRYRDYIEDDILVDQKSKQTFEKICHSVTSDLREIYREFLLSKSINIYDDLSVSIKLTVSPNILIGILDTKIDKDAKKNIRKKKKWVYTAYRDPFTFEKLRDRREVTQNFYSIEGNTAFEHTYTYKNAVYACDDLSALGASYKNENKAWKSFYNATLLAPIRFNDIVNGHHFCFGFIAIDSMNIAKARLFEIDEAQHIIGHSADLLATFFLTLAIVGKEPTNIGALV